jgi:hypothetical protein
MRKKARTNVNREGTTWSALDEMMISPRASKVNGQSPLFGERSLIVENNVEKRTVDLKLAIVANEAQLPKLVHE